MKASRKLFKRLEDHSSIQDIMPQQLNAYLPLAEEEPKNERAL
jgi:hypothetical protein